MNYMNFRPNDFRRNECELPITVVYAKKGMQSSPASMFIIGDSKRENHTEGENPKTATTSPKRISMV